MVEINIWGRGSCHLPNGNLCTACCVLPEVELGGTYASVIKPANSPCPNIKDGVGCTLQGEAKPGACKAWHCSQATLWGKLDLIAQGLSLDLVSQDQALSSAAILLAQAGRYTGVEEIMTEKVLQRSAGLTNITGEKDLVGGEINEP